jgi:hypothetical protein
MVLEDTPEKSNPPIEDFFGGPPVRLSRTEMNDKLPAELQRIPVHGVILFFEGHVFKILLGSFVPS